MKQKKTCKSSVRQPWESSPPEHEMVLVFREQAIHSQLLLHAQTIQALKIQKSIEQHTVKRCAKIQSQCGTLTPCLLYVFPSLSADCQVPYGTGWFQKQESQLLTQTRVMLFQLLGPEGVASSQLLLQLLKGLILAIKILCFEQIKNDPIFIFFILQ